MKTIYLVRHGKVDNPSNIFYTSDFPLGQQGVHQAQALAEDIQNAKCNPVFIVSSPCLRTRETAEIISQSLEGNSVMIDERLVEWQVANWFGRPLNDFRNAAGYNTEPFHLKLKNIEQFEEASQRMIDGINDVLSKIEDDHCSIIVSHREPMVAAILKLRGVKDWSEIPLLDFPPGACWKLDFQDEHLIQAEKIFDRSKML